MCCLPGSGKSTLSRALAERLGALRWDKDEVRHLLFSEALANYDRRLNELCMELPKDAVARCMEQLTERGLLPQDA